MNQQRGCVRASGIVRTGLPSARPRRVAVAGIAILVATILMGAGGASIASARPGPHTKVAGQLITGPGVELVKDHFTPHEGNEKCGDDAPDRVDPSSHKNFCYWADKVWGTCAYDTEVSFRYKIRLSGGEVNGDSGYAVDGHVLVPFTPGEATLSCHVVRLDRSLPAQNLSCETSTVNGLRDYSPEPHWKVTWSPEPAGRAKVYFLGDSVTAGFGFCGTEGTEEGKASAHISCKPNDAFANSWYFGDNSLLDCRPPDTPNDRCSNNNDLGNPWDAGAWAAGPKAPTVAYSYVIAHRQKGPDPALIYNWAMSGATPADWDPVTGGPFGGQLKQIKDSYVVMTLGANPLLSEYINVGLAKFGTGKCSSSTVIEEIHNRVKYFYAAPLDGSAKGVLRCFDKQWAAIDQGKHLLDVYKTLVDNGDHVLVVGYPPGCPWSFGDWQPEPNLVEGPAKGYSCTSKTHSEYNGTVNGGRTISQWDQATALGRHANELITDLVGRAANGHPGKIVFAAPQGDWAQHQAWSGSSWFFKNDTWVHPSVDGHKQLASTVTSAMCSHFHRWCGDPLVWNRAVGRPPVFTGGPPAFTGAADSTARRG